MTADEVQSIMDEAERSAIYFKQLVRDGVPEKYASELTQSYILGWIRAYTSEPLPPKDPWETE